MGQIIGSIAMITAIALAFLRVPLAFALMAVSVLGIGFAINWNIAFQLVPLTISDAVLSYDLAVVPMFILMGNVISKTGIANDLFRAAFAFVGHVRGGLALSTMMAVFLVLGCVMDSMAIILIFVPLFAPIVVSQGFDLVWFGIIVIVVTEIALITPPVGMNVFVLKAVLPDTPVLTIFKGLVPFIAVDIVRLALLVAFPAITLWLGATMG